jgi:hypothetical protein
MADLSVRRPIGLRALRPDRLCREAECMNENASDLSNDPRLDARRPLGRRIALAIRASADGLPEANRRGRRD